MITRTYRWTTHAALSGTYVGLTVGFVATWVVVLASSGARMSGPFTAAAVAYVTVSIFAGGRTAWLRAGNPEVVALAVVAVVVHVTWVIDPDSLLVPGQRCMPAIAVVAGAITFASRRVGRVAAASAVVAQFVADWIVVGPVAATGRLGPVVTAGIAAGVAFPLLRSAAGRADEAVAERRRAFAAEVDEAARRHVQREFACLLHDAVAAALRAISLPSVTPTEAREAAREAVAAFDEAPPEGGAGVVDLGVVDLGAEVRDLADGPLADVTVTTPRSLPVPAAVAAAVVGAAREALRNAARHARATRVAVTLREAGGGFVLEVQDDGVGLGDGPSERAGRAGLRHSVIGRVQDVGGSAEVSSAPGAGTTVRLIWCPPEADDEAPTRTAKIRAAVGDVRRPLAAACVPYLVLTTGVAIRETVEQNSPGWSLAWQVGVVLLTLALLACAHREVRRVVVLGCLTYGVAGVGAALGTMPPDAFHGDASWAVGAVGPLLVVVAITRPPWEAVFGLLAEQVAIIAMVGAGRFRETGAELVTVVTPAALSPVHGVLIALALGQTLVVFGGVIMHAERESRLRLAARSARAARQALRRRRLADLDEEILPFLREVALGRAPVTASHVQTRARALEHVTRDEIHLPGLFDRQTRQLLHRVRASGCVVTIRADASDDAPPAVAQDLLSAGLRAGELPREVVLTVSPAPERTVSLVTVPGDGARAAVLRERFGEQLVELDDHADATWVEVTAVGGAGPG